jgi:prevent-host-death family protein
MYKYYNINKLYKRRCAMLNKISAADARKKFANIINRVAYGKESFVLTRRGEALAAIVSMEDLKLLQEIEEQMDIEDAWEARSEPGESISWEKLREELDI